MSNPRTIAMISAVAAGLLLARIVFGSEGISPTLAIVQWAFLAAAVVGFVGALIAMNKK